MLIFVVSNKTSNNPLKQKIMKTIWINNDALKEVLVENGIELICNENMQIQVSDEDAERIPAIVQEFAPAAADDYGFWLSMGEELIDAIDFTEEEYNKRTAGKEDMASFSEFIDNIVKETEGNNGNLKDAIFIENDAFSKL